MGLVQGSYEKSGNHLSNSLTTLSTLPLGQANVCVHLTSKSRLPTALLLLPVILQAVKGLISPVGPHDWGAQSVTLTAYSPGQISVHVSSICSESPPRDIDPDPVPFLPLLSSHMWIILTGLFVH